MKNLLKNLQLRQQHKKKEVNMGVEGVEELGSSASEEAPAVEAPAEEGDDQAAGESVETQVVEEEDVTDVPEDSEEDGA